MSEKRGNTGKLIYDFNVSANLEVQVEDTWYRVTARDFRSFNGVRRIFEVPYEGPLYVFATNIKVTELNKPGLIFVDDINPNSFYNKRAGERD
jgi:hypothetical protein